MMILLENIWKSFSGQELYHGLNLQLPLGETTCFLGNSGSGKTTLFRLMMGLESLDQGKISGLETLLKSAVFQEDRLCEDLDVLTNILLVQQKKDRISGLEQAKEGLHALKLEGIEGKPVRELSGGMKRRVAILRGVLAEYQVLFLDEPFQGLDPETKECTMAYVKEKTRGKTMFCITHEKNEADDLSTSSVIHLTPLTSSP